MLSYAAENFSINAVILCILIFVTTVLFVVTYFYKKKYKNVIDYWNWDKF